MVTFAILSVVLPVILGIISGNFLTFVVFLVTIPVVSSTIIDTTCDLFPKSIKFFERIDDLFINKYMDK